MNPGIFSSSIPLNPKDALFLKCDGPITVKGSARSDVLVKGTGESHWLRKEDQVSVHLDGSFAVTVPYDIHLLLDLDGPITVNGVTAGDVEILSADGPITIQGAETLIVRNADGPLTIKNIQGLVNIEAVDGPVTIKGCHGNISVTADGDVHVTLSGEDAQHVRLRVDGVVFLQTPKQARLEGAIQADGKIIVSLSEQSVNAHGESVQLPRPDDDGPIISVDINATEDVYVGADIPSRSSVKGMHFMGWRGFLGKHWGMWRMSKTAHTDVSSSSSGTDHEPSPNADDFSVEREMILRMVAEGKITAQEGQRLLEALQ